VYKPIFLYKSTTEIFMWSKRRWILRLSGLLQTILPIHTPGSLLTNSEGYSVWNLSSSYFHINSSFVFTTGWRDRYFYFPLAECPVQLTASMERWLQIPYTS